MRPWVTPRSLFCVSPQALEHRQGGVQHRRSLRKLELARNALGDHAMRDIATFLARELQTPQSSTGHGEVTSQQQSLRHARDGADIPRGLVGLTIGLAENDIGDHGLVAFVEALHEHRIGPGCKEVLAGGRIDLSRNLVGDHGLRVGSATMNPNRTRCRL